MVMLSPKLSISEEIILKLVLSLRLGFMATIPVQHILNYLEMRNFDQCTLQDFSDTEIQLFIRTWHSEAFEDAERESTIEGRLRKAIAESPAIRELAANPLLLTMMAMFNRVQDLPRDRGRLYERCAELLLKNWDLEKFPELLEKRDTRDIRDKLGPVQ